MTLGTTSVFDQLSCRVAFALGLPEQSHLTVGNVAVTRRGHIVNELPDGRVLVVGGDLIDGTGAIVDTLDTVEVFDPKTQEFTQPVTTMTRKRAAHSSTTLADGRVLILGGYDDAVSGLASNTGEIWDPVANTTTPIADMAEIRTQHTATLLQDGRVLVTGGAEMFDLTQILASLSSAHQDSEIYDPDTDTWMPGPDLVEPVIGHNATLMNDGRVLITAGTEVPTLFGIPVPQFSDTCYRYDPGTNTFLATASLPAPFVYPGQLTLSTGDVIVAGGADGSFITFNFTPRKSVYRYNAASNTWTTLAELNSERAFCQLFEIGGEVIVIGGVHVVNLAMGFGVPDETIETSDLNFLSWTSGPNMMTEHPRELSRSAVIDGGDRLLTVGGWDDGTGSGVPDLTAEIYLP